MMRVHPKGLTLITLRLFPNMVTCESNPQLGVGTLTYGFGGGGGGTHQSRPSDDCGTSRKLLDRPRRQFLQLSNSTIGNQTRSFMQNAQHSV